MNDTVLAVIPARLNSSRFPGKAIYPYKGRPLLYYVWKQVSRARLVDRVLIATDSEEIAEAAHQFGAEVIRSRRKHPCGSDRAAEAASHTRCSLVINVQGDSLGLRGSALDRVIRAMKTDRRIQFATLATPIRTDDELFNPNAVKVVTGADRYALWFSRYPIPFIQRPTSMARSRQYPFLKHVGVYFYRASALRNFAGWKQSAAEKAESLEQLRILEHGGRMKVFSGEFGSVSVDSRQDLSKLDTLKL
jgi:3-deoxy-manno-octulosonate cytidylyltransferase (CMP-KDO synthetase)